MMKYGLIADEYKEAVSALGLNRPEDWMRHSVQDIVVDRTSETRRLNPPPPLPGCYAKIYRYPRRDDRLRILFRGGLLGRSRAKVECANLVKLHARGLAPQVVAYGQERCGGLLKTSLLIVKEVPDALPLDRFAAEHLRSFTKELRSGFIRALAAFTREMNAGGFINSEYHWRNILVCRTAGQIFFQVIDPSGSRRRYRLLHPFFDLATLDVCAPFFFTRTERLRFFKLYQEGPHRPLTKKQKRQLKQILTLRQRICKQELKRYHKILPPGILG